MDVEFRQLRYFVAAAEEVNFGRAARRLHVSQPALGIQIRQLEQELRLKLFERIGRGVRLTVAGTALLNDARRLLNDLQHALEHAQCVGRGTAGTLRVGHVPLTMLRHPGVGDIIPVFCVRYPKVQVQCLDLPEAAQCVALAEERIDIGIGYVPPVTTGLRKELIDEVVLDGVLLAATHPLARKTSLHCRDFANTPYLLGAREDNPAAEENLIRQLRERGLDPMFDQEHKLASHSERIGLVAVGAGWNLMNRTTSDRLPPGLGVVFRALNDEPIRVPCYLLCREDDHSPLVETFVALARELRAAAEPQSSQNAAKRSRRGGERVASGVRRRVAS